MICELILAATLQRHTMARPVCLQALIARAAREDAIVVDLRNPKRPKVILAPRMRVLAR